MALSFRSLVGQNIRTHYLLQLDCTNVVDVTRNRTLFEYTCPLEMNIVAIEKCIGNGEHPCAWEVTYMYKPDLQKLCNEQNAKKAFEEILEFKLFNSRVHEHDKTIVGNPPKYRIKYNITSCNCPTQDFELNNFIAKKLNNIAL